MSSGMDNQEGMKILIVDDEPKNIKLFQALCESAGYKTITATNGGDGVDSACKHTPDLILMDVMMPQMDGFQATKMLKKDEKTAHIPVIFLTSLNSKEDIRKGIDAGADDYLTKPVDSKEMLLRIRNHIKIKKYQDCLQNQALILDQEVQNKTKELVWSLEELQKAHQKTRTAFLDTIYRLTLASEYKDKETGKHIKRISYYTKEIASHMGMEKNFVEAIFYASPMHDIGKVAIPDNILLKQGRLTRKEIEIMKTHTTAGGDILKGSDSYYLQMGEEIARSHHERWNGGGYPNNLQGEQIPLSARIMNIADQYDALRSKRPYKEAFDHDRTVGIIIKGDGRTLSKHFDPQILNAFIKLHGKFQEIYESLIKPSPEEPNGNE